MAKSILTGVFALLIAVFVSMFLATALLKPSTPSEHMTFSLISLSGMFGVAVPAFYARPNFLIRLLAALSGMFAAFAVSVTLSIIYAAILSIVVAIGGERFLAGVITSIAGGLSAGNAAQFGMLVLFVGKIVPQIAAAFFVANWVSKKGSKAAPARTHEAQSQSTQEG